MKFYAALTKEQFFFDQYVSKKNYYKKVVFNKDLNLAKRKTLKKVYFALYSPRQKVDESDPNLTLFISKTSHHATETECSLV